MTPEEQKRWAVRLLQAIDSGELRDAMFPGGSTGRAFCRPKQKGTSCASGLRSLCESRMCPA